jgi:Fibrinogen beta and gamma chains, C-terminal globular domain
MRAVGRFLLVSLNNLFVFAIQCYPGNENIHLFTSSKRYRLRIDLTDWEGQSAYAEYDNFVVGNASDKYKLISLGTYRGTAGE